MTDEQRNISLSGIVETGKDLIALLRDGTLLFIAILLIGWPQTINRILVEAGFEEGSIAGLKWKAKLEQSDATLLKAQATIADLREHNEDLKTALSKAKSQISNATDREDIEKLEQLNARISLNSERVQQAVETTSSANALLVQQIQSSKGAAVTWGVVYGGDRSLNAATYEIETIAPKLGLTNVAVYYRNNSYRSVATTIDRVHAEQLLKKAKERRKDAYLVNMATWCPKMTEKNDYFECLSS